MTTTLEELAKISAESKIEARKFKLNNLEKELLIAAKSGLTELIIWEIPLGDYIVLSNFSVPKKITSVDQLRNFSREIYDFCIQNNWRPGIKISNKSTQHTVIYNIVIDWKE